MHSQKRRMRRTAFVMALAGILLGVFAITAVATTATCQMPDRSARAVGRPRRRLPAAAARSSANVPRRRRRTPGLSRRSRSPRATERSCTSTNPGDNKGRVYKSTDSGEHWRLVSGRRCTGSAPSPPTRGARTRSTPAPGPPSSRRPTAAGPASRKRGLLAAPGCQPWRGMGGLARGRPDEQQRPLRARLRQHHPQEHRRRAQLETGALALAKGRHHGLEDDPLRSGHLRGLHRVGPETWERGPGSTGRPTAARRGSGRHCETRTTRRPTSPSSRPTGGRSTSPWEPASTAAQTPAKAGSSSARGSHSTRS